MVSENKSRHINEKDSQNQFDLEKIKSLLIKDEKLNSSRIGTSPPMIINNMSIVGNSFSKSGDFETFDTQDRELLDILEVLGNVETGTLAV